MQTPANGNVTGEQNPTVCPILNDKEHEHTLKFDKSWNALFER